MNTLKNLAKKAVAVGSGTIMLASSIAFGVAADLSDYPSPFVQNGQFNGLIVVGETAATSDVLGSIEIASGLQAASTTAVSGGAAAVSVSGDAKKIGDSADMLEIGEFIGSVTETLTDDDLEFLRGGLISTDQGDTDFTQQIDLSVTAVDSNVGLYENNDDETGIFFKFNDGDELFRYELEFTSGLESDVESGSAVDLEDESLFILGQYFSIVNADIDDAVSDSIELELIAGDITDTLREGETKTYTMDGKEYEVTLLIVSDNQATPTAKFLVNGEATDSMDEGDTDKVAGIDIGVREVLANEGAEANGADLTEFYLGANKLELTDSNIATSAGSSVKINGETIEDATLEITGTVTLDGDNDGTVVINRISYTLEGDAQSGDSDVFLEKGEGLRQFLDEPEGMLAEGWDIVFQGVSDPGHTEILFEAQGDDQYDLTFTNRRGTEITVPYFYAQGTSLTDGTFGDEDDALVFWEHDADYNGFDDANDYPIGLDDWFVLTDIGAAGSADNGDDTYVLQFNDVDESENTLTFQTADGKEVKATWIGVDPSATFNVTSGDITIGGKDFGFHVYEPTAGVYRLAVDLDNDGEFAGTAANASEVVDVVVRGGGILTLANETTLGANGILGSSWTVTLTTQADDIDNNTAQVQTITFGEQANSEVDITGLANTGGAVWFSQAVKGEDRDMYLNGYGTWFDKTDDSSDSDSLVIQYPNEQVEALVYVVGGEVSTTSTSSSGAVRVNPLGVGFSVLDSEVTDSQFGGRNLIVVGGPCVNTVAARLLDNPADCTEGFTEGSAMLKLFDNGRRVALLVAGYSAMDTQGASRVLAQSGDYNLDGMEAELTVTSVNNVMVK